MKAKFIGDPNDNFSGPQSFTAYGGLKIEKGKWVEVKDPDVFRKLEGHTHYETQGSADDAAVAKAKETGVAAIGQAKKADKRLQRQKDLNPFTPPDKAEAVISRKEAADA
jgi:hypothetical protein